MWVTGWTPLLSSSGGTVSAVVFVQTVAQTLRFIFPSHSEVY